MKEFKNDNSKKLIIGVSILFCAVILIIGTSIAYFTQSDTKTIGNIVSTDKVFLEYYDDFDENDNYMRKELIPSSLDNVNTAYTREDINNICLDKYGYSACSIYKFKVKNIGDISQNIQMTLNPTANSFTNLKFMLFELKDNKKDKLMNTTDLIKGNYNSINLYKNYTLKPNEEKIYEIVFYIEAKNYDQTSEDSSKSFGAGIRINSITTGTYVSKNFGSNCWTVTDVKENDVVVAHKLEAFNGINNNYTTNEDGTIIYDKDYGNIDEMCTGYVEKDSNGFYSINVPSNVAGKEITLLGNKLFKGLDIYTMKSNNYTKIKGINIAEGITTIEDGGEFFENEENYGFNSTFAGVGIQIDAETGNLSNIFDVFISLPSTISDLGKHEFLSAGNVNIEFRRDASGNTALEEIDDYAFSDSYIDDIILPDGITTIGEGAFSYYKGKSIIIPSSVVEIKKEAFYWSPDLEKVIFENTIEKPSQLYKIGAKAYFGCNLTYVDEPLIIPPNIQKIEYGAFVSHGSEGYNPNLKKIEYKGTSESILNNTTNWYETGNTQLNPNG